MNRIKTTAGNAMAKKDKRMKHIVELLQRQGKVSVKNLSKEFLASEMTIRRYLDELENNGLVKRTHGGAVPVTTFTSAENNKYLIGNEIDKNVDKKNRIGYFAASLINSDETVAFDIGTTIPFIAKYLPNDIKLSAICVTYKSAFEIYHKKNVNLILPGGYLDRETDVFHSDEAVSFLSKIRTDKVFISVAGIDLNLGLTCYHDFHVTIKKLLMQSSKQVIVVADSSKFGIVNPSYFGDIEDIDKIITDKGIPSEYEKAFHSSGVELMIVE